MRIERFDPEADPARLRACYQAYLAGAPIDDPHCPPLSLSIFTSWLVCGWSEDNPEVWFAGESPDQADGCCTVAMPQRENRHLVYFHPEVPPASRRAGVGTALLRHAATQAARLGRPHRGHRLGLLIKAAMLDLLAEREPQLRWVTTGNADSNSHMIAINEQLGYQVLDSWASWQLDVADVLALSG
jgi:GNAT superfamily N-acetyltransferase